MKKSCVYLYVHSYVLVTSVVEHPLGRIIVAVEKEPWNSPVNLDLTVMAFFLLKAKGKGDPSCVNQ